MKLIGLLGCIMVCASNVAAQSVIFVSPDGNDLNPGDADAPVRTVEKALQKARSRQSGESVIYLRDGEYRFEKPLQLTQSDGNKDKSLTLAAYPGESPVIKGSVKLECDWHPYRNGIMQTRIEPGMYIDMILINGDIRHMARYPDYDATAVRFNGTSADATSGQRVKKWKNPEGGYLHAMHVSDWGDFHYRIKGKDKDGNLILDGGWQNNRRDGLSDENRMVENIFEELDAPGEWYYDNKKSILYYYPMPGENLASATVETPQLKHLIEMKGCDNVTVKGLELTQTARTFMEEYEPLLRSDWTVYRGGAVLLENTGNCVIDNCYLHNLGGNAIFISDFNRDATVRSSHITRVGASGICFVGNTDAVRSPSFEYHESVPFDSIDHTYGPKTDNYPARCLVYDNLIHNIGLYEKQVTAVELSMCRDITVSHNSIYNTPRAGINVSEGTWGGHVIEYNDVFDTVKETGDHGSFNSWGRDRFWHPDRQIMDSIVRVAPELIIADVIQPVVIHDNRFRCDRGWDIDLDDGSSNYHIYNNLCLNGGIKLREGFYRRVENNILINNTFHPHVWFDNSGDSFTRNIVMTRYAPTQINNWGNEVDYNIFTDSIPYRFARENDTDSHSIVCKVRFVDSASGDFRVDKDAVEVFRQGFQNFDMSSFGVVSPKLKKIAASPIMPVVQSVKTVEDSPVIRWSEWKLKNLSTPGEQSATGMSSIRGVYVVAENNAGTPLKANDVILKVGGADVNHLDDFLKAIESASRPVQLTIFRNQHEMTVTLL